MNENNKSAGKRLRTISYELISRIFIFSKKLDKNTTQEIDKQVRYNIIGSLAELLLFYVDKYHNLL